MDGEDTKQPAAEVGGADRFLEDDDELALGAEKKSTDRLMATSSKRLSLLPLRMTNKTTNCYRSLTRTKRHMENGQSLGLPTSL